MSLPALVPQPGTMIPHDGVFRLDPAMAVEAPVELAALVRELLGPATGYRFPDDSTGTAVSGGSAGSVGSGDSVGSDEGDRTTPPGGIRLVLRDEAELGAEGYRLIVTPAGVTGYGTEAGLRWAVQTLRQLLPPEIYSAGVVRGARWEIPAVEIVDVPRYPWRGSLLDVARWCHPIDFLYRYVDAMAVHKLNRLHLHLTDDQGWRFEVRRYPRLTEVGGFRLESNAGHARQGRFDGVPHGGWYSQQELRGLVDFAARRGVQIMPEIDLPGHMQAAISAYPELGNYPDVQWPVRTSWGISGHVLNVAESTVEFVGAVLDELVDVFPFEYVHLGGDEVPTDEWAGSSAAGELVAREGLGGVADLVGWWTGRLAARLATHGRKIAVWDELVDRGAPAGSLVFGWQDESRVAAALAAGFPVVAVPQRYTYLDWAESDRPDEPLAIRTGLPLSTVYSYRPGEVSGVQGQLWSEYLPTPALVEYRAYPRLAALAEVGWTAPDQPDVADLRDRLAVHLRRLDALGLNYRPLDPTE